MNTLLLEGLVDATGFVAGGLLGFGLSILLGLDIFAPGYSNASLAGIVLLGVCGGAGVQLARKLRAARAGKPH